MIKIGNYVPFDGMSFRIVRPNFTKPNTWVLVRHIPNRHKMGTARIIKTTQEIEDAIAEYEVDKVARSYARVGSTHGIRARYGSKAIY